MVKDKKVWVVYSRPRTIAKITELQEKIFKVVKTVYSLLCKKFMCVLLLCKKFIQSSVGFGPLDIQFSTLDSVLVRGQLPHTETQGKEVISRVCLSCHRNDVYPFARRVEPEGPF